MLRNRESEISKDSIRFGKNLMISRKYTESIKNMTHQLITHEISGDQDQMVLNFEEEKDPER